MKYKYIQLRSSHFIGDLIPYSDEKLKETKDILKKYGLSDVKILVIK